jgi:hypothetical protein
MDQRASERTTLCDGRFMQHCKSSAIGLSLAWLRGVLFLRHFNRSQHMRKEL